MKEFINKLIDLGTKVGGKVVLAIIVLIVGCIVIRSVKKGVNRMQQKSKIDKTVQSVIRNVISVLLYAILIIAIIGILGIPTSSVIAVLASCGLALGLAMQGALGNLAGGLIILLFKPFRVGDFIESTGAIGTVKDISIFYTVITTIDNKRISVPNGSLMNSNVTNFSAEPQRRIDIDFKITNDIDAEFVKSVLLKVASETEGVLA